MFRAGLLLASVVAALFFVIHPAPAHAEKRIALAVGNAAYQHTAPLRNPINDVRLIAKALGDIGFEVALKTDLAYSALREAIRDFRNKAADADVAVIYFAGHGLELGGENFLLPIDARLSRDVDLDDEAVSLTSLLRATVGAKRLRLVILDACRTNPLGAKMRLTSKASRSVPRGLARFEPQEDVLIAYSARAGTVALDGDGATSPFAAALLKHLATPGLDVRLLFGRVRDDVLATTKKEQEPFIYGSLKGEIISLIPGKGGDLEAMQLAQARLAAEAAAKAKAEEAEARRLAEEAAGKLRKIEEEASRLKLAMQEAERQKLAAAEEARRLKAEAEEEAERLRQEAAAAKEREEQEARDKTFVFKVCNNSSGDASVAIAYYSDQHKLHMIEGWWTVKSGACETWAPRRRGWFYYYASASDGSWSGDHMLCVSSRVFLRANTSGYQCSGDERLVGFKSKLVENDEFTWNIND